MLTIVVMSTSTTTSEKAAIKSAIKVAGSADRLAVVLGITRQAIYQWSRAPAERVLDIERATGVSRHDLRPDLYPTVSGAAA